MSTLSSHVVWTTLSLLFLAGDTALYMAIQQTHVSLGSVQYKDGYSFDLWPGDKWVVLVAWWGNPQVAHQPVLRADAKNASTTGHPTLAKRQGAISK